MKFLSPYTRRSNFQPQKITKGLYNIASGMEQIKGKKTSNSWEFWITFLGIFALNPQMAIALPAISLPDTLPANKVSLSSCQNLDFTNFVPNQTHFGEVDGNKKYHIDTVWTATASDGTTATMRTVRVNNNSGGFDTTGNNANVFFTEFTDPNTTYQSPKLNLEAGEASQNDSWELVIEYSRPIGNARLLVGDIDSQSPFFKDVISVEGFFNGNSLAASNTYAGSELDVAAQGNLYTFQDKPPINPNLGDDSQKNRGVVDYENTYVDTLNINYIVGDDSSYTVAGKQALFLSSGMSAGCKIGGNVFEDDNSNDLFDTNETKLDSVAVSIYLDNGDDSFDESSDTLIETQNTNLGQYEFTNLAENEKYWVRVDDADNELTGYSYGGGDVESDRINPRLIEVANTDVSEVDFPYEDTLAGGVGNVNFCYLVADGNSGASNTNSDILTKLSRVTGNEVAVGTGTNTSNIEAIAFDPLRNKLYAGNGSQFGEINLSTGQFNRIGNTNYTDIDGLAIDSFTGDIYASIRRNSGTLDQITKINPVDGTRITNAFGTGISTLNVAEISGFSDIDDITVDPTTGEIFGVANNGGGGDLLVKIVPNAANNVADTINVGTFGVDDMEGFSSFLDGSSFYGVTGNSSSNRNNFYAIDSNTGNATFKYDLGVNFNGGVSRDYEAVDCAIDAANTLSGKVFGDRNNDGNFDSGDGDTNTADVTVRLYRDLNRDGVLDDSDDVNGDGVLDESDILTTTETDSNGEYIFQFAAAGAFIVNVDPADLPANISFSTNNGENLATANFGSSGGQTITDRNFGYVELFDYGDAPIDYDDTADNNLIDAADNPARHSFSADLFLGSVAADNEITVQSSVDANGDDSTANSQTDDEDGIANLPDLNTEDNAYSLEATVNNTSGDAANVYGWLDFDRDGEFDQDEKATITGTVPTNGSGTVTLTWNNLGGTGIDISNGNSYVRIRLTTDNLEQTPETTARDDASVGAAGDGEVEDYQVAIINPNQTINTTSSCTALGGTLTPGNLFTPLDNGTFGFENGQPDQTPATNPYPGIVSGGVFDSFYSVGHGDYGYVANAITPRNNAQHDNITDPVYGVTGRFFASDPDSDTPTLTTTLTGLTPNQFYEYSFWAANSEFSQTSPNNTVNVKVTDDPNVPLANQTTIYSTGELPAFPDTLEWKKHTVSFTNGASSSITINLQSTETGPGGNDFYLDNIELRGCNFIVDYGDAPSSYGDAIHTTIPTSPTIYLGNVAPDGETETPLGEDNGVGADGDDDNQSTDDEDAFGTLDDATIGSNYVLNNIPVRNTSGADVNLHGWIDFNQDGKFSAAEYQSVVVADGETTADLNWTVPNDATLGDTYIRLRITPDVLTADDPSTGDRDERSLDAVINGEVEDHLIRIGLNARLRLVKRITAINPGQPGEVVFNNFVDDTNDDDDDAANWSDKNTYLRGAVNVPNIQPGDEVEYTIYFLSDGASAVSKVSLCDVIPDNMTFVENSYGAGIGIGLALDNTTLPTSPNSFLTNVNDSDRAEFYLPNSTPPTFCKKVDTTTNTFVPVTNTNNTNGAVVLDLETYSLPPATPSGTPSDSYGFLRFRAKIQ